MLSDLSTCPDWSNQISLTYLVTVFSEGLLTGPLDLT